MSYEEIIKKPYIKSDRHPHMSMHDRAAQFAPFAALTGHKDMISEAARLTDSKIELDEYEKERIDAVLRIIADNMQGDNQERVEVIVTYFEQDSKKAGGEYLKKSGKIKKIDIFNRCIVFEDLQSVDIDDILQIDTKEYVGTDGEDDDILQNN